METWRPVFVSARHVLTRVRGALFFFFFAVCRLVLMADEVYQENIYQSRTPFTSCKKVSEESSSYLIEVDFV